MSEMALQVQWLKRTTFKKRTEFIVFVVVLKNLGLQNILASGLQLDLA